jgi:sugar porter (SP) family MFS transporter
MPKKNVYILGIAIVAAVAGLLFGFDVGIIAGALPFIEKTFHIVTLPGVKSSYDLFGFIPVSGIFIAEYIVAAVPGGALLGAMISAKFAHRFGRKNSVIITALLFLVGALMACGALNFSFLIASRTLMGFSIGISATIVPMYVAEVAPAEIRGAAIFLYQMAITVGIFLSAMVSYIFTTAVDPSWRYMFALELIPAALLGIGMLMLPKSPRWLMRRGRSKAALNALKRLRQSTDPEVHQELEAIEASLNTHQKKTSFRDLFEKPLRILVVVAAGLFFFQQFTGINTIFYYAPIIFQGAGFKGINGAFIAAIMVTGLNVLATFFGMWFVDSLGRRKLLLFGLLGIVLCMFTMGAAYHNWFSHKEIIVLISALAFIACFAISISGICYIIMSEIFPLNVRSKGMAIASCANWGFNWLVASTFLSLVNFFGLGYVYWFYALCSLVGLIFVFFLVPETKNRTLEDITSNLYAGVSVRHLGDTSLIEKHGTIPDSD